MNAFFTQLRKDYKKYTPLQKRLVRIALARVFEVELVEAIKETKPRLRESGQFMLISSFANKGDDAVLDLLLTRLEKEESEVVNLEQLFTLALTGDFSLASSFFKRAEFDGDEVIRRAGETIMRDIIIEVEQIGRLFPGIDTNRLSMAVAQERQPRYHEPLASDASKVRVLRRPKRV